MENMGTGPRMSPEEIAKNNKSRILSDAKLVKGGADVTAEGAIKVTGKQKTDAKLEMGDAFYKKSKQLETDKEALEDTLRKEKNKHLPWYERKYVGYSRPQNERIDFSAVEEYIKTLSQSQIADINSLRQGKFKFWQQYLSDFNGDDRTMREGVAKYLHGKEDLENYLAGKYNKEGVVSQDWLRDREE